MWKELPLEPDGFVVKAKRFFEEINPMKGNSK
jgi:hypothetical protein